MNQKVYCPICTAYGYEIRPNASNRRCWKGHVFSATDGLTIDELRLENSGYSVTTVESVTTSLPLVRPGTRVAHAGSNPTTTWDEP